MLNRTIHLPTWNRCYSAYPRHNNIKPIPLGQLKLQFKKDCKKDKLGFGVGIQEETFRDRRGREKIAADIIAFHYKKRNNITITNKAKQKRIVDKISSMTKVPGPHRGKRFDAISFRFSEFGI